MLVVSGLELGSLLCPETRLMTLGHNRLFTWCRPVSCACSERVYRCTTPLSQEDAQDARKAACLNACLA